jgi:hypothetical protein
LTVLWKTGTGDRIVAHDDDPRVSQTSFSFNDKSHARNWADKYFGGYGQGSGYSATGHAGGRGGASYATVTKTDVEHQKTLQKYQTSPAEMNQLKQEFGDFLKAKAEGETTATGADAASRKRVKELSSDNSPKRPKPGKGNEDNPISLE